MGDHDEELPRDGGHDARLRGHAAAALEQVGLDRLGHDRARGQAEHQRVHHDPHREQAAEARAAGPGARRRATSRRSPRGTRRGWAGGGRAAASPASARGPGPGPRRRSAGPRRAAPATGGRAGAARGGEAAASSVAARSLRGFGAGPPPSLPAARAPHTLHRGGRDPGPARQRDVRLGLPLGARGARRRLRGGRLVGRAGRGGRPRLPRDARRLSRPVFPGEPPIAEGSFLDLPARRPRPALQRPHRVRPPQPAARRGAGGRELHRLLPGAGADPGRGVLARGQGHLLPARAHPRPDGVGGPRRRGRPAPREPRVARAARDDPPRGLERPARARGERDALQEPRPARHADRGGRVHARARRGRGAAARHPPEEPRGAVPLPPHGGRGRPAGVRQGAARARDAPDPHPGGRPRALRVRPAPRVRRGGAGRGPPDRTSRCSCPTSPSSATSSSTSRRTTAATTAGSGWTASAACPSTCRRGSTRSGCSTSPTRPAAPDPGAGARGPGRRDPAWRTSRPGSRSARGPRTGRARPANVGRKAQCQPTRATIARPVATSIAPLSGVNEAGRSAHCTRSTRSGDAAGDPHAARRQQRSHRG